MQCLTLKFCSPFRLDPGFVPLNELTLSAFYADESSSENSLGDSAVPLEWRPIAEKLDVSSAVAMVVELLADPPAAITSAGFHMVTMPLGTVSNGEAGTTMPLPKHNTMMRLYLTDYPDPRKLLELKAEESGCGVLEVTAKHVSSGATSEYLPDAYRPLFVPVNSV